MREGDSLAEESLYERYKLLVRVKVRPYFLIGADNEDLVQEGMIGLYKAVLDYRDDKKTSFRSFADLCITRQMLTAIKRASRKKHTPLNSYISLNQPFFEDDGDRTLLDLLQNAGVSDPEEVLLRREFLERVNIHINDLLSKYERRVLHFYLAGLSYQQIAEHLGKNPKSIDNAIQRIKKKLVNATE